MDAVPVNKMCIINLASNHWSINIKCIPLLYHIKNPCFPLGKPRNQSAKKRKEKKTNKQKTSA